MTHETFSIFLLAVATLLGTVYIQSRDIFNQVGYAEQLIER